MLIRTERKRQNRMEKNGECKRKKETNVKMNRDKEKKIKDGRNGECKRKKRTSKATERKRKNKRQKKW